MQVKATIRSNLVSQKSITEHGKSWHKTVLDDLVSRLSDTDFPCVFSKGALHKGLLLFIFVESVDEEGIRDLANGLVRYVELSRHWTGSLNTAYPLVIAFSLCIAGPQSLESYHHFGWDILQRLHEIDPAPWPSDVDTDPDAPTWSMCFNGMPLFCNMSHPAHSRRRSRNLGEHFLIIVNPRERFDVVAGDTPTGRKVRANIRARITNYDGMPHSPQLACYGAAALEWWQYSMADVNANRADKCPFKFMSHNKDL